MNNKTQEDQISEQASELIKKVHAYATPAMLNSGMSKDMATAFELIVNKSLEEFIEASPEQVNNLRRLLIETMGIGYKMHQADKKNQGTAAVSEGLTFIEHLSAEYEAYFVNDTKELAVFPDYIVEVMDHFSVIMFTEGILRNEEFIEEVTSQNDKEEAAEVFEFMEDYMQSFIVAGYVLAGVRDQYTA